MFLGDRIEILKFPAHLVAVLSVLVFFSIARAN